MAKETVKRIPIKLRAVKEFQRTPIKLEFNVKMKLKLRELQYLSKEEEILEMSEYYDYLAAKTLNRTAYNSLYLTNKYKEHRNWIHFESVWEICRMKDWDRNLYLEAQFERARNWKTRMPYPNMLYSVPALRYFTSHLSRIKQNHAKDLGAKNRERSVQITNRRERLISEVTKSIEFISEAMRLSKQDNLEQYKVLKIYHDWDELSPYYLWCIPWFSDILPDLEGVKADEIRESFKMIDKSHTLKREIQELVQGLEKKYNIPRDIEL